MQEKDYSTIQVGGPRTKRRGVALVDRADAEAVGVYPWCMSRGYAVRGAQIGGKRRLVLMHRFLLGLSPGDGVQVDHINGNKLDNRRANLRVCTNAENHQNLHHCGFYRGVSWHARKKRWQAYAYLARKKRHLGYYASKEEAAVVASAFRHQHMPYSRDARE